MRMECSRADLLEAITRVRPAVAPRSTKEVLMNIKAVLDGDTLTLSAYDMEVGIRYEMNGVSNGRNGSCILLAKEVAKILAESSDETVTVTADENEVILKTGNSKFAMPNYSVDEFPDIPLIASNGCCHDIDSGELKKLIARTKFAVDKRDTTAKFALNGVMWEANGNEIRLTGTDTKRLATFAAKAVVHTGEGESAPKGVIVPLKAIGILEQNLPNDGESARAYVRTNGAMFQFGRITIFTSVVQGKFPPTPTILAKAKGENGIKIVIPVPLFTTRIRQAAIMTDDESCRVDVVFESGNVTMNARGAKTGASEVKMELPTYTGKKIETAYDPAYLTDFLKTVGEHAEVELRLSEGNKAGLFLVPDGGEYLIMPLTA